jgi:hypothetical protein
MFLKDNWYVAAFAEEVTRKPVRRTLLGDLGGGRARSVMEKMRSAAQDMT